MCRRNKTDQEFPGLHGDGWKAREPEERTRNKTSHELPGLHSDGWRARKPEGRTYRFRCAKPSCDESLWA